MPTPSKVLCAPSQKLESDGHPRPAESASSGPSARAHAGESKTRAIPEHFDEAVIDAQIRCWRGESRITAPQYGRGRTPALGLESLLEHNELRRGRIQRDADGRERRGRQR